MTQADYIKDRIEGQIRWYELRAGRCKRWYKRLRVTSIVVSLSIPILTSLIDQPGKDNGALKIFIAVAGALVALIEGVLSLNKYHELWTGYRATSEGLKYHRYLFETGSAPYNAANAFQLFVQNAEGLMASEHTNWMQHLTEKQGAPAGDDAGKGGGAQPGDS